MFTQPSVNQIASTYQGNPAPLAQKVEADKKQHGGIPQDLRQLLALNDITQGRQSMGIQQALQTPTNIPTVAQSLQERARQMMQARPMMQPAAQGLNALPTNVGEEYAHGGIIGDVAHFDGQDGSEVKNKSWIERLLYSNISPAEQARKEAIEAQAEGRRVTPTKANLERDINMAEVNRANPNITQDVMERIGLATRQEQPTQQVIGQPATPAAPAAPAAPKVNVPAQPRVFQDNAPMPAGLAGLVPAADTEALGMLKKDMRRDPEAEANALRARYMKEVGARDLSPYDRAMQSLEERKARLNAPKAGIDSVMDLLENIAQSKGRTWQTAGSEGALNQKKAQALRQQQQDELVDKILELGGKKAEAQYNEKKGMFEMTQKEREEVYKKAYEAAKSVNASDDKAKELAQQAVLEREKMRNQLKVASMGAHDNLMSRADAIRAENPGMTREESMKRAAMAAGATSVLSTESKDKAKGIEELLKLNEKMPVGLRTGNSAMAQENRRIYNSALSAIESQYGPLTGGGATTSAQPIPAGAGPKDLTAGTVYQTARGPAKWNGKAFDPV
jgi:hypothetical protein